MYSGDEIYPDEVTSGNLSDDDFEPNRFDEAGVPSICLDWHEEEACSKDVDRYGKLCGCLCEHCQFVRHN